VTRNIDRAVAEFEPDGCTLNTLTGQMRIEAMPYDAEADCELLVPVHAYQYLDHTDEKLAVYAGQSNETGSVRLQGSYAEETSAAHFEMPVTVQFRVEITPDRVGNVWLKHDGDWYRPAHTPRTEQSSIRELDVMTELQSDAGFTTELKWGRIQSRWSGLYTQEYGWTTPERALRWSGIEGPRGDHDGEVAAIDWMRSMESGAFVFDHYFH